MAKIRTEELHQLAGEVLPERTVLGALVFGTGGGDEDYAQNCQSTQPAGLVGALLNNQGSQCQGISTP